jgi:molybdopterin-dependent oxidoreductase alpha subunit
MAEDSPHSVPFPASDEPATVGHVHEYEDATHDPTLGPDGVVPGVESPDDTASVHRGKRFEAAAGLPAVWQTLRYVWGNVGVVQGTESLLKVNKVDGFDCQSCAWPSPDKHRKVAEFCENGAKAIADEGTKARVTPEFFRQHSIADLLARTDFWLNKQGRLTHPMVLRQGASHYEPITWDEAFRLVAEELNGLSSPDQATFYTSGKLTNEPAYLYQLFVREFGTNNLPDCSNMCHESSGTALNKIIGIGKGTVTLEDFLHTDLIFVIGQNPGTNHPRMLSSLEAAKERGAKIVSVNPLPETGNFRFEDPQKFKHPLQALPNLLHHGVRLSDVWLPVKINGDLALFKGIMKEMLAEEEEKPGSVFDHDFIRRSTVGYDDLIQSLRSASWDEITTVSGLSREQIRHTAEMAMRSKATICCWAMGLTQHKNAVETIQEVLNFMLLRGNIGRPGAGPCCVRGHSNVQGDRTMGIWERVPAAFLDALEQRYGFKPPCEEGKDTVNSLIAMHRGDVKVFVSMGGNLLGAGPDTNFIAEALQRCSLTVAIATKLNRAHLVTGRRALLLPCLGRSEIDSKPDGTRQFVTVEDSMGIVNPSRGHLPPASKHLLSETAIIARMATAVLGKRSKVRWEELAADYDRIRDEIAAVVPGFKGFNERIKNNFFYLPNLPRERREFPTEQGKAILTANPINPFEVGPGEFALMTMRSHDQFNTTIYGLDDRYRGIFNGRRVLFMNPKDVEASGFVAGQPVDITSHFADRTRHAAHFLVAPYDIPRGCVATYYPEGNVLVPITSVADHSNQPTYKSVRVTLQPSTDPGKVGAQIRAQAAT